MVGKPECVDRVAELTGLKKQDIKEVINTFLDVIIEKTAKDEVSFIGFGKFSSKTIKGRVYKIPNSKKTVKKGDTKTPKFTAGKKFKETLKA